MNKTNFWKRILAIVLVFAMVSAYMPEFGLGSVSAAEESPTTDKIADTSTMEDWLDLFGKAGSSTEYAGAVRFDKSVFTDVASYFSEEGALKPYGSEGSTINTLDMESDSFLIALSAIASSKSIVGYSHLPTDTMLVLDVSGSMNNNRGNNDAVSELVDAANLAITELLKVNKHNRVGVVLYSGSSSFGNSYLNHATLLLELDRYTAPETYKVTSGDTSVTVGRYLVRTENDGDEYVAINRGNTRNDTDGVKIEGSTTDLNPSIYRKEVVGGTYIQSGLELAKDEFLEADTIIAEDEFQAGTTRLPVFVLMSDGAPTVATRNYQEVGTSTNGNGGFPNNEIAFFTQLTAAYAKGAVDDHYVETTPLFYTMGFKVDTNEAHYVLDPESNTSTGGINAYWDSFINSTDRNGNKNGVTVDGNRIAYHESTANNRYYVDEYFTANTNQELISSFESIVEQIILQSLYRPTFVTGNNDNLDGYIDIIDDIGEYMEVKDIKGIVHEDKIFTGAEFAKGFTTGKLGTTANPTDLGNEFVWSVIDRLGIDKVTDATGALRYPTYTAQVQEARALISQAYNDQQIHYTSDSDYSNYIAWYADENNQYIGFWDQNDTAEDIPSGAKYVVKSYGMLGEVNKGVSAANMMYISIRVSSTIDLTKSAETGALETTAQQLVWKIPSSLIPLVKYEIELTEQGSNKFKNMDEVYALLNDSDPNNDPTIKVTISNDTPIRLLAEVGLKDEINAVTVEEIVAEGDASYDNTYTMNADGTVSGLTATSKVSAAISEDGNYYFYTNKWNSTIVNKDGTSPTEEINTVGYFEPSKENERYYFAEDTRVYVKEGDNYVPYTGTTQPASGHGTYYHLHYVFEQVDGEYTLTATYHPTNLTNLAVDPLASAVQIDGKWYIPKGTPHHTEMNPENYTSANETDTVSYSIYPKIEYHANDGNAYYYFDAILGNNGRIGLTPATGIVLEKAIDHTISDTSREYNFTLTSTDFGTAPSLTATLIKVDANGNETKSTLAASISEGVLTLSGITLKAGEKVYIIDLPAGTYTVTENIPDGSIYKVGEITVEGTAVSPVENGTTVTVTEQNLTNVAFTNVYDGSASLFISKTVEHPYDANYTIPDTLTFPIEVTVTPNGDSAALTSVDVYSNGALVGAQTLTDNKFTYNIKAGETIRVEVNITDPEDSYTITVEEKNIPTGFELKSNVYTNNNQILTQSQSVIADLVNTYDPADVSITSAAKIIGSKTIDGRPWISGDVFEFVLQRYTTEGWVTITPKATVEHTGGMVSGSTAKTFDLNDALASESPFKAIGTYTYRVIEIEKNENGLTSDKAVYMFYVEVGDPDMDGDLDIVNIATTTADNFITKSESEDFWTIATAFENQYQAEGTVNITLSVDKTVTEITESAEDEANPDTGATADDIIGTDGEVPADDQSGAYYEPVDFHFGLWLVKTDLNGDGDFDDAGEVIAEPNMVTARISTTLKPILDADGNPQYDKDTGDQLFDKDTGYASFGTLSYTTNDIGKTYVYEIREEATGVDGMYEAATRTISVTIVDNYDGTIGAIVKENGKVISEGSGHLEYSADIENVYVTPALDLTLSGTKLVNGAVTELGKFNPFTVVLTGEGITDTKTTSTVDGSFTFNTLKFEKVGTYTYTVKETAGSLTGMTYDQSEYQIVVKVEDSGKKDGTLKKTVTITKVKDAHGNNCNITVETLNGITFDNTYDPTDLTGITITGTKTVENGADHNFSNFTFELSNDAGVLGSDETTGAISFALGSFTAPGENTYTYYVAESVPAEKPDYITYDQTKYKVTVTTTDEDANGKKTGVIRIKEVTVTKVIDAEGNSITEADQTTTTYTTLTNNAIPGLDFNNIYDPADATVTLEGLKDLEGASIADYTFNFILSGGNLTEEIKVSNDTEGKFSFPVITYTASDIGKTYTYKLVEETVVNNDAPYGMTYDLTEYEIVVEVLDDVLADGKIETKTTITKVKDADGNAIANPTPELIDPTATAFDVDFTNVYTCRPDDITVDFVVNKTVKNLSDVEIGPDGFEFKFENVDTGESTILTTDEEGLASLSLTYTEDDAGKTYNYRITEVKGDMENMEYSEAVYDISVTVTLTEDNELVATVDGESIESFNAFFENIFEEPIPDTGDYTNFTLWFALLLVSGAALTVLGVSKKRKA